ncbi:MAG: homocysteine S-methyltransferase family protein [Paracoccaceae bacterium]|nr:homocysteine S-methyltransferase family protein [Paracoccaceae bacterium]
MTTSRPWPADAGLETFAIFHEGRDLPQFASFVLLDDAGGRAILDRWFGRFVDMARAGGTGFVLDTATWRANMGWAGALGLDQAGIARVNAEAVAYAKAFRARHETADLPILVNGLVGPSGDGYRIDTARTADEAEAIHAPQIEGLAGAGVDLVTAMTMTYPDEAIGIARAAARHGLPHVISFTVETDGRLISGLTLHEAIAAVDAATGSSPLFYMVNCAHPTHFGAALPGPCRDRIGGIRANASRLSHAELDEATELDDGDPVEFGALYAEFPQLLPKLRIIGGCCGTDHRHVGAACGHLHQAA